MDKPVTVAAVGQFGILLALCTWAVFNNPDKISKWGILPEPPEKDQIAFSNRPIMKRLGKL